MIGKAPAGGIVSHVNGQFYEGGQFTPDHGLLCGKGRNKVTKAEFEAATASFASAGRTLVYVDKYELFRLFDNRGVLMNSSKKVSTLVSMYGA